MDPTPPPHSSSIWRRFRSGTYSEKATSQIPHYVDVPVTVPSKRSHVDQAPILPKRYQPLTHPRPINGHRDFPNHTSGGQDLRWPEEYDGTEEECWVGPMLYVTIGTGKSLLLTGFAHSVTALIVPHDDILSEEASTEVLKRIGAGRSRWASFTIDDLDAIAPWLDAHIEKKMEGMGLGN